MDRGIDDLLTFISNGQVRSPFLHDVIESIGARNVRIISIELFDWLKRQYRFGHEKALILNDQYTWCRKLPDLLEMWTSLDELFQIEGGTLNFREEIPAQERARVRETVAREYRPVLRT